MSLLWNFNNRRNAKKNKGQHYNSARSNLVAYNSSAIATDIEARDKGTLQNQDVAERHTFDRYFTAGLTGVVVGGLAYAGLTVMDKMEPKIVQELAEIYGSSSAILLPREGAKLLLSVFAGSAGAWLEDKYVYKWALARIAEDAKEADKNES